MKIKKKYSVAVLISLITIFFAYDLPFAKKPHEFSDKEKLSIESIDEKIFSLGKTLESILEKRSEELAGELGITVEQIEKKIKSLTLLRSAYIRLKNSQLALKDSQEGLATIQKVYEDYLTKGMSKKPPYSLTFHTR